MKSLYVEKNIRKKKNNNNNRAKETTFEYFPKRYSVLRLPLFTLWREKKKNFFRRIRPTTERRTSAHAEDCSSGFVPVVRSSSSSTGIATGGLLFDFDFVQLQLEAQQLGQDAGQSGQDHHFYQREQVRIVGQAGDFERTLQFLRNKKQKSVSSSR